MGLWPCKDGINIYIVPVMVGGEVAASSNFGYGTPPNDKLTLRETTLMVDSRCDCHPRSQ